MTHAPADILLTPRQMGEADRLAVHAGVKSLTLMEAAGKAVAEAVMERYYQRSVLVLCGPGNNGGDGFVVARLALLAGWPIQVVLVGEAAELQGDARLFFEVFVRLGGDVTVASEPRALREAVQRLKTCDTLVDALLGTGFSGALRQPYADAVAAMPGVYTVAVDVPSGLDAETGAGANACVRADVTVTFHAAKPGLLIEDARLKTGRLVVADIGIPAACGEDDAWEKLCAHSLQFRCQNSQGRL